MSLFCMSSLKNVLLGFHKLANPEVSISLTLHQSSATFFIAEAYEVNSLCVDNLSRSLLAKNESHLN